MHFGFCYSDTGKSLATHYTDFAARPAAATKRLIQSVSAAGQAELSAVSDQLSACQLRTPFANITPQLGH
jgi:hypothetical protein